jgi:hypothetical protein
MAAENTLGCIRRIWQVSGIGCSESCDCICLLRLADYAQLSNDNHCGCCCAWFIACRPAEDRKGVKDALVEMTKTSRAAVRPKSS